MIWPGRRGPRGAARAPRTRKGTPPRVDRLALADLRLEPQLLLGRVAYLKLALFESASAVAGRATALTDREAITRVAAQVLGQHTALVGMLEAAGFEPVEAMHPYTDEIDRYRRRLADTGWHESVLTLHLATGILDDFFASLALGMRGEEGRRASDLLRVDIGHESLVAILEAGIGTDQRLASRLAVWGRRLVGDTLLLSRHALADAHDPTGAPAFSDERRVDPVLNDLIAAHSRRMDRLHLTA